MYIATPGNLLEQLCAQAQDEVVLVAPFIKVGAFRRILQAVTEQVKLLCVTRWRPEEIVGGISDTEIWLAIRERPNSTLWLRPNLHAKYYRSDNRCMVGSANITMAAFGWSQQSNLELLVEVSSMSPQVVDFEDKLLAGSVQVDNDLYNTVQKTVSLIKRVSADGIFEISDDVVVQLGSSGTNLNDTGWLPVLRYPELLYSAYVGNLDELTSASREAALADLAMLPVARGLSREAFGACVSLLLLQKPIIKQIDEFVSTPQRFGAVRNFLATLPCNTEPNFDPSYAWQTLMRWLRYFLPERYGVSVPRYSEVFYRLGKDK